MENLSMIVAVDQNDGIGYRGNLLYHLKGDMAFFKKKTMGHSMILGRKTLESFPGGNPLPGRKHLVLSRENHPDSENVKYFSSKEEILDYVSKSTDMFYVIGGAQIYEMFFAEVEDAYITVIDEKRRADAFFPMVDIRYFWKVEEVLEEHCEEGILYRILHYRRGSKW